MAEMNPDQLAKEALKAYPIASPTITFLRHNENITFRVVDAWTDEVYLLRIHSPLTETFRGERQLPEVIASELRWLEALSEEMELVLQRPVLSTCTRATGLFRRRLLAQHMGWPSTRGRSISWFQV